MTQKYNRILQTGHISLSLKTHTHTHTEAQTFNTLAFAFSAILCQMRYKTAEEMVCCVSGLIMAHTLYVDGSTSHNLSFSHLHIVWYQHWAATSISVLHYWGSFSQLSVKPLHELHVINSLWRLIKHPQLLRCLLFSLDKSRFIMETTAFPAY